MARLKISGLVPGTAYSYRFEVNGIVDTSAAHTGSFRTPLEGAIDMRFAVGSCNQYSSHPVWQAMLDRDPLFYLNQGDLHYEDPIDTTLAAHRAPLLTHVLDLDPAALFLHRTPIAYTWDDHDFCGDASTSLSPARNTAFRTYREFVPHYPLALQEDTMPIYQSFVIGRLRFILSDVRGTKTPTQMMDSAQHSWLRHELVQAKLAGQLAVWVTALSWNASGYPENWGSAPAERQWLADFLRDHGIRDMLIICGDAHMLSIDSGENGDFSTGTNNPWRYPVFQAAAINRAGSYKGGTFDQGGYFPNPIPEQGQFGMVHVLDDGSQMCITLEGFRTDSMSTNCTLINSYTFCRTPVGGGVQQTQPVRAGLSCAWSNGAWTMTWPGAAGSGMIDMIDPAGRALRKHAVEWIEGRCTVVADHLPPGTYVIRATNAGRASMVKTGTW